MTTLKVKGTVSPVGIAFLNWIPIAFGIGYLFIGDFWRFVFVFVVLQLIGVTIIDMLGLLHFVGWYLAPIWIGTIIDGYIRANKYNKRKRAEFAAGQEIKQEEARADTQAISEIQP